MDFNDTNEEAQFREEVNNWLSKNAEKKQHASDIYKAAGIPGDGTALQDAKKWQEKLYDCLLYTSPSPRDLTTSRMPSSA